LECSVQTFHSGAFGSQLTLFFADKHGLGSIEVTVGGTASGEAPRDEKKQGQP
jgi:hypothetical protein